jgi:uncharacterized protein YgfB (UPF0149 family)
LDALLQQLGVKIDTAECHGLLCGLLCAAGDIDNLTWAVNVIEGVLNPDQDTRIITLTSAPIEETEEIARLKAVYDQTVELMDDPDYGFNLLLPDEELPLGVRVKALGHWCQGFIFGLSMGGINNEVKLPGESNEILRDLAEIGRIAEHISEMGEEEEGDFAEIEEYVRMGVLLLREELRPLRAAKTTPPIVH